MSKCKQCDKRKRHIRTLDIRIRNHNDHIKKLNDRIETLEKIVYYRKHGRKQ